MADIKYISHIQDIEARGLDGVGFLPPSAFEREINTEGLVHIAEENGEKVGYIYATKNRHGVKKIQQVCVQEDARRLEIGTELVDSVLSNNDWLISLRCREQLPALTFWQDLGFEIVDYDDRPKKRKQGVYRLSKIVGGLWIPHSLQGG